MSRAREEIESHYRHVHHVVGEDKKYAFDQHQRRELTGMLELEVLLDIRAALKTLNDKLEYGVGIYNAT